VNKSGGRSRVTAEDITETEVSGAGLGGRVAMEPSDRTEAKVTFVGVRSLESRGGPSSLAEASVASPIKVARLRSTLLTQAQQE
jgi:hypothetical protein